MGNTGTIVAVLALVFLIGHVVLDMRALVHNVRHPKDMALTIATMVFLGGHLILDWIGV
ncbi:hypothetical protein LCGC14_2016790 [marine sediment metagenome]|uniref:Uncharacterized protein n=1 Tax=marine sediment metagenome TaxID=412755 RepID=A0A0F9FL94_9ZZZZ